MSIQFSEEFERQWKQEIAIYNHLRPVDESTHKQTVRQKLISHIQRTKNAKPTLFWVLGITTASFGTGSSICAAELSSLPISEESTFQSLDRRSVTTLSSSLFHHGTIRSDLQAQVRDSRTQSEDSASSGISVAIPSSINEQSTMDIQITHAHNQVSSLSDKVKVSVLSEDDEKDDPFAIWNKLQPKSWWRESEPYSCARQEKQKSVWRDIDLEDLGGSDALSLIRYYGNGSYLRYGHMGFYGCTTLKKYPDSFYLDPPVDPTYYSLGDLNIYIDIARVPEEASGWFQDDGKRIDISMSDAVSLLNEYVAGYFKRISDDQLRIVFVEGNDFDVPGDGSPTASENEQYRLVGACLHGCEHGAPGGLNRILLSDVAEDTGGRAYNGWAGFGLASIQEENMELIVHEMGHGWMSWPHSFPEVAWRAGPDEELTQPNPYTNFYDIMSQLDVYPILGWDHEMPSTLAINRYAAGWIQPENVALHLEPEASYTLSAPHEPGYQFLVIHSGRRDAFTTLEVLEQRPERFKVQRQDVVDYEVVGSTRARRYEGVLVSRYDQSAGTGTQARFGPALYYKDNPNYLEDVGWGRDDYSLVPDGGTRELGNGVRVRVDKNADGTWNVSVSGGLEAKFKRWCEPMWFSGTEYDTGCSLEGIKWDSD